MIALVTLFAFLFNAVYTDIACAGSDTTRPVSATNKSIVIPPYLGHIKNVSGALSGPTVVHIQDAHCNYRAQQVIAELIGYLAGTYGANAAYIEGGEGSYDLSAFAGIADKALREKTADHFAREGVLGGAELFAVRNPGVVTLRGVEDTSLYRKNLAVYRDALRSRDEVTDALKQLKLQLAVLKQRIYPRELIAFDLKRNSLREKAIGLKEYCAYLTAFARERGVLLTDLHNLAALHAVLSAEATIDFKRANAERDEVVERLTKYLPRQGAEEFARRAARFRLGSLTASEFYADLARRSREADIVLASYRDLDAFIRYTTAYDTITKEDLFTELAAAEERVKETLFSDPDQRELDRLSKRIDIISDIFAATLTPDEYAAYAARKDEFDPASIGSSLSAIAARHAVDTTAAPDAARLDRLATRLADMEQFYALSYRRDEVFLKRVQDGIVSLPHHDGVVILVTGGFHSENLARLFKDRGISYLSVLPHFGLDETPCPYFKLLAGEQPGLIRATMASLSTMAIYSYFSEHARDIYGDAIEEGRREWVAAQGEILAGREVTLGGKVTFVTAAEAPQAPSGGAVVVITDGPAGDGKVYALWRSAPGSVKPASRSGPSITMRIVGFFLAAWFLVGAIFVPHVAWTETVSLGVETGLTAVSASPEKREMLASVTTRTMDLLEDKATRGILERYREIRDADALKEKIERTTRYLDLIPPERIALFKDLAAKAGIDENVLYALEGVETNFSAILEPDDLRKQVNSIGANGPLQVMLPTVHHINTVLIPAWDKEVEEQIEKKVATDTQASVEAYVARAKAEGRKVSQKELQDYRVLETVRIRGSIDPDKAGMAPLSSKDKPLYEIVRRFGLGRYSYLNEEAIPPLIEAGKKVETDPKTGRKKTVFLYKTNKKYNPVEALTAAAVILGLDHYTLSHLAWKRAGGVYELVRSDEEVADPGYDVDLAMLTAYNGGENDAKAALEAAGPRTLYRDEIEWYARYLAALKKIQIERRAEQLREAGKKVDYKKLKAEGVWHSTDFSLNLLIMYLILEHQYERAAELESLRTTNSIFLDAVALQPSEETPRGEPADHILSEAPLAPPEFAADGAGSIDENLEALLEPLGVEVRILSDAEAASLAEQPAAVETGDSVWSDIGTGMLFIGKAFVVVASILASIIGWKWVRRAARNARSRVTTSARSGQRRSPSPSAPGLFMEGRIFDRENIRREKADKRFTVVFDLDDTLIYSEGQDGAGIRLREEADSMLNMFGQLGVKRVLWTSATREWVETVFEQYPTLLECFDRVITRENYLDENEVEGEVDDYDDDDDRPFELRRFFREKLMHPVHTVVAGSGLKNLGLLGYDVLVDDTAHRTVENYYTRGHGFKAIAVPTKRFGDVRMMVNRFLKFRVLLVRPYAPGGANASRKGIDMMQAVAVILQLIPPPGHATPPGETGQIGNETELVRIRSRGYGSHNIAVVRDVSGRLHPVGLREESAPDPAAVRAAVSMVPDADEEQKRAMLAVLALYEHSPPSRRPRFYTFTDRVADFRGFASPRYNCVALHKSLADDPVALFHELGEFYGKRGELLLSLSGDRLTVAVNGIRTTVGLSAESLAIARKADTDPDKTLHYRLRALARECFGDADRRLTGKIKTEKESPATTVVRPMDGIPAGEVRNILVYTLDSIDAKLGESIISEWPLVSGLFKAYPGSVIYIATAYPHLYESSIFRGRVVPIPLSATDARASRYIRQLKKKSGPGIYTVPDLRSRKEERKRFIMDHAIDMVVDSSRLLETFRIDPADFPEGRFPHLFKMEPAIKHARAMDYSKALGPAGWGPLMMHSESWSGWHDAPESRGEERWTLAQDPSEPVYMDRQGRYHRVIGLDEMLADVAPGDGIDIPRNSVWPRGELGDAGIWDLSIGLCRTLGLPVSRADLLKIRLNNDEFEAAQAILGHYHALSHRIDGDFEPLKKVVVINVYAQTHGTDIIDLQGWVDLITELVNANDAYYVFTSGGRMDTDAGYVKQIYDMVKERVRDPARANQLLVPRDQIYPVINDILGIADAVITIDTGFSHLASGVFDVPTVVLTLPSIRHWLTPRDNRLAVEWDGSGAQVGKISSFISAIVERQDSAQVARIVSNYSLENRMRLDSLLVSGRQVIDRRTGETRSLRIQAPAAEEDLRRFAKTYLADIGLDPDLAEELIPDVAFVDSALQLGIDVPRFRAKLYSDIDRTYLLVDRSVLVEKEGIGLVIADAVKNADIVHEIFGHRLLRSVEPDFEGIYREAMRMRWAPPDLSFTKTIEEILARFVTEMVMGRMYLVDPDRVPVEMLERAFLFDKDEHDIRRHIDEIFFYMQSMPDEMTTARYKRFLSALTGSFQEETAVLKEKIVAYAERVSRKYFSRTEKHIQPGHITETSHELGSLLKDAPLLKERCTIGVVVKGARGSDVEVALEEQFALQLAGAGRAVASRYQVTRGVARYEAGDITYVVYVDDGTSSPENRERLAAFRNELLASGTPPDRTFAWALSARAEFPQSLALDGIAHVACLDAEYPPASWQMLAGPLFANLIYSRKEGLPQERIDALVASIIAALRRMTRTDAAEWAALEKELRDPQTDLSRKFNGSFVIKLPPIVPVAGAIEDCRVADLAVRTAL